MRILIIEDDAAIADAIGAALAHAGHAVDRLDNGRQADAALRDHPYDLVVLDLGLPDVDGVELLRRLRSRADAVPVLVATAREELEERVRTLDLGADDYLVKPFVLPELAARSRALIRRMRSAVSAQLTIGGLALDLAGRIARIDGAALELTRREWSILECLALQAGHVVGKERLLQAIASWEEDISRNAIEVYVSRLRAKLGAAAMIRTVRGLGYRLDDPAR